MCHSVVEHHAYIDLVRKLVHDVHVCLLPGQSHLRASVCTVHLDMQSDSQQEHTFTAGCVA